MPTLYTLGRLELAGERLPKKCLYLLAYLLVNGREATSREYLAGLLWPRAERAKALHSLTQAVSRLDLKKPGLLAKTTTALGLPEAQCDYVSLRKAATDAPLALGLYRGAFLPDAELDLDTDLHGEFLEWVASARERAADTYLGAVLTAAELSRAEKVAALEGQPHLLDFVSDAGLLGTLHSLFFLEQSPLLRETTAAAEAFGETLPDSAEAAQTLLYRHGVKRAAVPFTAPGKSPHPILGRSETLAQLKARLLHRSPQPVVIYGLPGVGKTALALELAYDGSVLAAYPDGVLWAGVGKQTDAQPILGRWLRDLGLSAKEVGDLPATAERRNTFSSLVAKKSVLVVLDDVWDLQVYRDLVVGDDSVRYLVTLRSQHSAFALTPSPLRLPELPPETSGELLATLSPVAPALHPGDADTLVRFTGGLPLAITLVAGLLRQAHASGLASSMQRALARLSEAAGRVRLEGANLVPDHHPSLGAPLVSLAAVIGLSVTELPEQEKRDLAHLTVFPPKPNTFSEAAALAVVGDAASLEALIAAGLVEAAGRGRFSLHQTIYDYLLASAPDRRPAGERMTRYYLAALSAETPDFDFLTREEENLDQLLAYARRHGELEVATVNALYPLWQRRGEFEQTRALLLKALQLARSGGDRRGEVATLLNLGKVANELGLSEEGIDHLEQGLGQAEAAGFAETLADFYLRLGGLNANLGRFERAEMLARNGYRAAVSHDQPRLLAANINLLGVLRRFGGDLEGAVRFFLKALPYAEAARADDLRAMLFQNLAGTEVDRGNREVARSYCETALALAHRLGHLTVIGHTRINLGNVARKDGDLAEAQRHFTDALELFRATGYRENVAHCLAELGVTAQLAGRPETAARQLEEALALARDLQNPFQTAWILTELGTVRGAAGQAGAREAVGEALRLAAELGSAELEGLALLARAELSAAAAPAGAAADAGQALDLLRKAGHGEARRAETLLARLTAPA